MAEDNVRPSSGWPRWRWPTYGWLLSAALAVITIIGYLIPHYSRLAIMWRIVLVVALIVVIFAGLLGQFGMWCIRVAWQKAMAYDAAVTECNRLHNDLRRARFRLMRLAEQSCCWPEYTVNWVEFNNGHLYLHIAGDGLPDLVVGDELFVLDNRIQTVVGRFAVSKDENNEYVAGPGEDVNALWMGYYVAKGLHKAKLPVDFAVFCVSMFEKGTDNEF